MKKPREEYMDRRNVLSLCTATALALTALPGHALAQTADVDAVKAASKAFYEALPILDNGEAMDKVWAHTNYVTYVGPRSKSIIVGWDAQKKYWVDTNKLFSVRAASLTEQHIHINGNLAWEVGQETGETKMKDGAAAKIDFIVTNVYEKIDGRWLIVSHHVQPKPQ
jgi:ketosteroid isomerase-like protein